MHLFMITSGNKIGINIGTLFIFLAFDQEGGIQTDTLPPERRHLRTRSSKHLIFLIFICPAYLNVLLFQLYTY